MLPTCCICCSTLGTCGGPASLGCGHNACLDCLRALQRSNPVCPLCRTLFSPGASLAVNLELQQLLHAAGSTDPTPSSAPTRPREEAASAPPAPPGQDPQQLLLFFPRYDVSAMMAQGRFDVESLEPPAWLPDSAAPCCMAGSCERTFSLVSPRHHCRLCGGVFCHDHARDRMMLPHRFHQPEPQRCCRTCAALLAPSQPRLAAALSTAMQPAVHDALDAPTWRSLLSTPYGGTLQADVHKAAAILKGFTGNLRGRRFIPQETIRSCAGLAVLSVLRVGAGWSVAAGTGVLLAQRRGTWTAPCAVGAFSAGVGWQIGAQLTHLVLVLNEKADLEVFCRSSLAFGAAVAAAAGPLGREASASVRLSSAGHAMCIAYSQSRGAFAGVALEGMVMRSRDSVNDLFYGRRVGPRRLLLAMNAPPPPPACAALYQVLADLAD